MKRIALILLMLPLLVGWASPHMYQKTTLLMDTLIAITVVSDDEAKANAAIEDAFATISATEKAISFWTTDSDIAAIGKSSGVAPVKVGPITLALVEDSLVVASKSDGAFDPTVGTLMRLWDFKKSIMPTDAQIAEKMPLVDYKGVIVDHAKMTVFLKKTGMAFDTGGIAKGFGVDRAVDTLKARGITSGLVTIGGEIRGFGRKPDGAPWRVGIRNPRPKGKDDEVMATIDLDNMAISTSGDYERFFLKDGVRYHHIMDPKTGHPARGFTSVSIVSERATTTDGFSTGIFVLGPKRGVQTVKREKLGCIAVLDNGETYVSDNLAGKVQWKIPQTGIK